MIRKRDAGWSVEMIAMPWKILREAAADRRAPRAGAQWRGQFFRAWNGTWTSATGVPRSGSTDLRVDGLQFRPVLSATPSMYEIVAAGFAGALVHIKQEGRVWVTRP
jgi:hypothetical protein